VRMERLELSRFYSLEPKSSAATNYATSANHLLLIKQKYGRSSRIRTYDLLVPNQAHYQAVLRPENVFYFYSYGAPDRIRTHNFLIRSQVLYPIELRAH
jgi:hypothetical protein